MQTQALLVSKESEALAKNLLTREASYKCPSHIACKLSLKDLGRFEFGTNTAATRSMHVADAQQWLTRRTGSEFAELGI
jgi:hypothetical protein